VCWVFATAEKTVSEVVGTMEFQLAAWSVEWSDKVKGGQTAAYSVATTVLHSAVGKVDLLVVNLVDQ
jgi:hypothetical protein